MCCKDSYFGKLEEIKKGCFICGEFVILKEYKGVNTR